MQLSRRRFAHLLGGSWLALLCPAHSRAPGTRRARPRLMTTAIETEDLKLRAGRTIEILERHIQTGYLSGAVALIGRGPHAEVVVVGEQSFEAPRLMQRDSLFRITSMTTPIYTSLSESISGFPSSPTRACCGRSMARSMTPYRLRVR